MIDPGSIDWNSIATSLVPLIPPIETRVIIISVLFLILLCINLYWFIHDDRSSNKLEKANDTVDKEKKYMLQEFIISKVPELSSPTEYEVLLNQEANTPNNNRKPSVLHRLKTYLHSPRFRIASNLALGLPFLIIIGATLFVRPIVIRSSPVVGSTFTSAHDSIKVEFDLPIEPENMVFNISPDIEGEWEFEPILDNLDVTRTAIFYPKESFYPGEPIVVYITGIESLTKSGKQHEHALEFMAPPIPLCESISPESGTESVPTDASVVIAYDSPIGDFVETTITIEPQTVFSIEEEGSTQTLIFESGLSQDTTYSVTVNQTPRSYNIETGENMTVGETEEIATTSYTTVATPGIASYSPKGESVHADSPITIEFDQEIDPDSAVEHFSIEPTCEGEFSWADAKNVTFTPAEPLQKDTSYTVTFSKGIRSINQGITLEDSVIAFKTIGKVAVSEIYPNNGSYGLDPNSTNISIKFNQEVDHASAQQHFAISPAASHSFSWDGNILTISTAGHLAYSTRYTFSISSGVKSVHGLDSAETFTYAFTTKDNIFALPVPLYGQVSGFSCNLVAAQMALAYRGVYISPWTAQSWIGIGNNPNNSWVEGYGTHWGPLSNYIRQYRSVTTKSGWTLSEVLHEVQAGNPVILYVYNRYSQPAGTFTFPSGAIGYTGMHSEVLRGYIGSADNPSAILTNDPWRGHITYSVGTFNGAWGYMGNTAIVVR